MVTVDVVWMIGSHRQTRGPSRLACSEDLQPLIAVLHSLITVYIHHLTSYKFVFCIFRHFSQPIILQSQRQTPYRPALDNGCYANHCQFSLCGLFFNHLNQIKFRIDSLCLNIAKTAYFLTGYLS